jgi:predicted RNA methylase
LETEIMGKHENSYPRSPRDFYPTRQAWVTEALLAHFDITGLNVLEPAAGEGHMAEVLKASGAAHVFCNDIEDRGYPLDQISDFTTAVFPKQFDVTITNPPQGGRTSILF